MQYRVSIYKAEYVLNITLLGQTRVRLTAEVDGEKRIGACGGSSPQSPCTAPWLLVWMVREVLTLSWGSLAPPEGGSRL